MINIQRKRIKERERERERERRGTLNQEGKVEGIVKFSVKIDTK